MSEWGLGAGDNEQYIVTDDGEETDESEEENGADTEQAITRANLPCDARYNSTNSGPLSDQSKPLASNSSEALPPNIEEGEYRYCPVFAFSEAHVLSRHYVEQEGLDAVDSLPNEMPDVPTTIAGKRMSWWNDDSLVPKHPFFLINPLDFKVVDVDEVDMREVYDYQRGDQFVFADSGGYQIMSRPEAGVVNAEEHNSDEAKIHPETLVDWQIRNADAGASLDLPPYEITGDNAELDYIEYTEEWHELFQQRKEESAEMAGRMAGQVAKRREDWGEIAEQYIYSPVIQGKFSPKVDAELVREWHESVREASEKQGVTPRGWTLSPKPSQSMGQLAGFLGYAADELDDAIFVHALMVGGKVRKALLMFYAMLTNTFVTSDSSSHTIGDRYRKMYTPNTALGRQIFVPSQTGRTNTVYFERMDEAEEQGIPVGELSTLETQDERQEHDARYVAEVDADEISLDRFPCNCTVCSTIDEEYGIDFITEGNQSPHGVAINLHNLMEMMKVEQTVYALLRKEEKPIVETDGRPGKSEFWRYMRSIVTENRLEDLYRAMDFIRLSRADGLDEAFSKYTIKWEKSGGSTITRASSSANANW